MNAFGAIVDRDGTVVRGHYDPESGARTPLVDGLEAQLPQAAPGNTTLTLVVTNQQLTRRELRQLGVQVHGSMGRAIQPFHALVDGDVLYTVSTNEVENPEVSEHEPRGARLRARLGRRAQLLRRLEDRPLKREEKSSRR